MAKYGKTACYKVNNKKYTVYSVCGIVDVLLMQTSKQVLYALL